jgi:hypothetical protein
MLQRFKTEISRLQYPHGKRYAEDAIRAFGMDSTMAEAAKIWAAKFDMLYAGQGIMLEAMSSYYASKKGKAEVKESEKKLLEWAKTFVS